MQVWEPPFQKESLSFYRGAVVGILWYVMKGKEES